MLLIASLVSVTSCDYIDDLFTETVNIKVGESKTIESPNSTQWYGEWVSDNPFVAYAVGQKVYGNKVGKARFRAVRSSNPIYTTKSTEYVVNVFPSFTLFEDPIIQWGMSQEKLISKRGTPDSSNDNYIFYNNGLNSNAVLMEGYEFVNGKLEASIVAINNEYYNDIHKHLDQRFRSAGTDDEGNWYYVNAQYDADVTLIACVSYSEEYTLIVFYPYGGTKGNAAAKVANFIKK